MKKIKVAFFAEILIQDFDGASRTMYQILNRIPRDEFEFIFFCGVEPDKDLGFEVVKLPTFRFPSNKTYQIALPYFSKKKLRKKLAEFQPDVIHFASPSPLGKFAKEYALQQNIPVVGIYHTHFISYIKYYLRNASFLFKPVYKKAINITKDFYQAPDIVFTPTQQIMDELKNICGLQGDNLKLWQRGIDPNIFHPSKRDKQYLNSIVQNDHPTILFASRLVWEKNLQALISLYELCEAKQNKINFVVAGDGVARKAAQEKMPKANFLGTVDHHTLAKLYASSDVFFFPSDTETFGNVVLEAMASGLPCVVANGGGPKSFVKNGVSGFVCPVDDIQAYWEKIQILLHNDELRTSMIAKALEFTNTLRWENLVQSYFNDLKKLAQRTTPKTTFEAAEYL